MKTDAQTIFVLDRDKNWVQRVYYQQVRGFTLELPTGGTYLASNRASIIWDLNVASLESYLRLSFPVAITRRHHDVRTLKFRG
jgi:hypothetical protein